MHSGKSDPGNETPDLSYRYFLPYRVMADPMTRRTIYNEVIIDYYWFCAIIASNITIIPKNKEENKVAAAEQGIPNLN